MTQNHLLPADATPLEKALSLSMDGFSRLALPADAIREFKSKPGNPLLPWLIWEYGIEELLPYLPDPRRAIAEGILWQRLRGAPAALVTALSWIGMRAAKLNQAQDLLIYLPCIEFAATKEVIGGAGMRDLFWLTEAWMRRISPYSYDHIK